MRWIRALALCLGMVLASALPAQATGNLCAMTTATTGTGTVTLGSAVASYLSFADCGITDGQVVTYTIAEGSAREIGTGTYTSSGTTLSRTTVLNSTNSGSKISLAGNAKVYIGPSWEDVYRKVLNQAPADDSVIVGDSTTAGTFRALADSDGATQKLQYDTATNTFSAGTDDDVPESADVVLAGDVDGNFDSNDIDEASVETELESVIDLADLQGDLALGTKTSGNYVDNVTGSGGVAVTGSAGEGWEPDVALDFSDAGASPALSADTCRFSSDATTAGYIVCEGDTADTAESRMDFGDPSADRVFTLPNADSWPVTDRDYGDLTVGSSGQDWQIDTDAVGATEIAAGAVGASEAAALDTGDITTGSFADARVDGSLEADEVNPTLGTQTQGNYVADISDGTGIDITGTAGEGWTATASFDFSDAGASPALAADTCRFSGDATSNGEIVCEGDTADTIETRIIITDPTSSDKTFTIGDGTTYSLADADKGDITVGSSGTDFQIDADAVGAGEISAGAVGSSEAAALDTGDITTGSFADARVDGSLEADEVNPTLGSQTQGNYVDDVIAGTGVAVTHSAGEGSDATVAFSYTDKGADPALGADECYFSSDATTAGYIVCEGDTANTSESRMDFGDPTADRVFTLPDANSYPVVDKDYGDLTVSASGQTWNIDADTISTGEIATDGVDAAEIAADAVRASEIQADAVGDSELDGAANFDITGSITLDADALQIDDTNASHQLVITPGSDLSADRVLTITTGDAARTLTLTDNVSLGDGDLGDITVASDFTSFQIDADAVGAAEIAANSVALTTDTTGNYVLDVADGTGIDGTAAGEGATYTPSLDLTEISSATWGAGSFTTFTFDAGATDPTLTFGSGTILAEGVTSIRQADAANAGGALRLREDPGTGSNYLGFEAPASVTSDATCTLENDSNFIPDSCVGDGSDAGADGLGSDGDKGDVTVGGSGTTLTIDADSVALTTDTTGNYVGSVADGTGIDGTASGEGATYTPSLDLTEISSATLGSSNFTTLTFSGAGGSTATPVILDLGPSYADTIVGSKAKFKFWNDGTSANVYGIGISASRFNNFVGSGAVWHLLFGETDEITIDTANTYPATNDGNALGKSGNAWADLWLASGGLIEFSGGTTNTFTCASGDCTIEGNGIYRAGGTDVAVADGGTGASSLSDLITLSTHTTGSYVQQVADGTGVDGSVNTEGGTYTPSLDLTEISSATWGAGSFTTFTFDAGATDPTVTYGSGTILEEGVFSLRQADAANAGGQLKLLEDPGTGSNFISLLAPAAITSDVTCTLENDSNPIPDSCVGDGTDGGGVDTLGSDGDKGDVTVGGTGTTLTIDADSVALTTDTTGNYVASVADGTGIDVTGSAGEGWTATVNLDFSDKGASPALGADECYFSSDATAAGNIVCEGDTANTSESRMDFGDPSADRVFTLPDADSWPVTDRDYGDITVSASGQTFTIDADTVALTTDTTGNYAAGDGEAGAALTGDSATDFFSAGTVNDARIDGSAEADEVNPTLGTQTQGNYVDDVLAGTALDVSHTPAEGSDATLSLDTTEINDTTFGDNSDASIVWTFNQSGTGVGDPLLTAGDGIITTTGTIASVQLAAANAGGALRVLEDPDNGANYIALVAPTTITSNVTCTLENDSNPIPDSCVGDGTDGGGGGLANVVEDTTPQLGGDLDLNTNAITGTGDINITGDASVTALTTGSVTTTGAIELGNASDTSLARSAAGEMTIEGDAVKHAGKQTIWVPASAMTPNTTNGCTPATNETTTNDVMYPTCNFNTTTQQIGQFNIALPKSWNESTVTYQVFWSHPSTATNFGVEWDLACVSLSNDDALDTAFGTAIEIGVDTGGTTDDVYVTSESSAVTCAGTPAEGDQTFFRVRRVPADAGDNLAVDARIHGVKLFITDNASTDE